MTTAIGTYMQRKICTRCQEDKPLSAFYQRKDRPSVTSRCKLCMKDMNRAYHRTHKRTRPEGKSAEYMRGWKIRNPERHAQLNRIHSSARRARELDQFIEDVDPKVVYETHGGRCGICGEFISGDFHVDHVKPLARGGMHGYINTQPAHPSCNLRKGARVHG